MKRKHKVLIIDDEPNILNSLRRALTSGEVDIYTAPDTEKATEILKQEDNIEVIICDNRLPGVPGIDFLTKIKPMYPDTIRILITGYPDLSTAMDAINKAHIWRYLLKPVEIGELKMMVGQAFNYYKIVKENRLLLQIARQQAEWLKILQERYPDIIAKEVDTSSMYIIEEKQISSLVEKFMERYYKRDSKDDGK